MKPKYALKLVLLSFVLFFALVPLGLVGHDWKLLVSVPIYFVVTLFLLQRTASSREKWLVAAILVTPLLVLYVPALISDFKQVLLSFPSSMAQFVGIALALLAYELKQKTARFLFFTFLLLLTMLAAFKGYPLWLHKLNFGTFTGKVSYTLPAPINGLLQHNRSLRNEELQGKVVLLDFWHTRCGICFRKFPQLQTLYNKYKNNSSIEILAVNKPLETDTIGHAFAVLERRNYSFPVLIPSDNLLPEAFGVSVYPTVIVVDKNGSVVFRGDIEHASVVVDELLANDK